MAKEVVKHGILESIVSDRDIRSIYFHILEGNLKTNEELALCGNQFNLWKNNLETI